MTIRILNPEEYRDVLRFIDREKPVISPYIPIDLEFYSEGSDDYGVYLQEISGRCTAIVSVYHDDVQLWASEDADHGELRGFVSCGRFNHISSTVETLGLLGLRSETWGAIYRLGRIDPVSATDLDVRKAPLDEDYTGIAALIKRHLDDGSEVEAISALLKERNRSSFGRNYFLKDGGRVIAHAGTYGESETCSVVGGVVVDPEYRGRRIAQMIVSELCSDLVEEGKSVFLMAYDDAAIHLYEKIGFRSYCSWGRMPIP
ncbi:MAG: GNAT family N-acetyltransferase [Candidatus Methanomethylophilaceae archaeon]|nr:GNAT family N-acetyltransferase [Candidatus Methanomethylophilaceae archaeon]